MQDSVAVVTGAASGIGRATARTFAERGARVAALDIDGDGVSETTNLIGADGGTAMAVEADVADSTAVSTAFDDVVDRWGGLDFVHNNAAIEGERKLIHEQSESAWDRVIDVNLKGVWLVMKAAISRLLDQEGGGVIVNTASTEAHRGSAEQGPYVASKHGVIGLTTSAAKEYGSKGIRVNAVSPGPVETPMLERYTTTEEQTRTVPAGIPLGRLAEADEVANAVVWLCSGDASYVNGHSLTVDGGRIA